jgi:hypothetical protein
MCLIYYDEIQKGNILVPQFRNSAVPQVHIFLRIHLVNAKNARLAELRNCGTRYNAPF